MTGTEVSGEVDVGGSMRNFQGSGERAVLGEDGCC